MSKFGGISGEKCHFCCTTLEQLGTLRLSVICVPLIVMCHEEKCSVRCSTGGTKGVNPSIKIIHFSHLLDYYFEFSLTMESYARLCITCGTSITTQYVTHCVGFLFSSTSVRVSS